MMDVYDLIFESFLPLFYKGKYTEAIEILHQAWNEITDKSTQITEQCDIQYWLGCCYFEQIKRVKAHPKRKNLLSRLAKIFPLFTKKYHN